MVPVLLGSTSVHQDDAETAREIRALVDELHLARAERLELVESVAADRARLGFEITRLQDDLEIARTRAASFEGESERLRTRAAAAREQSERLERGTTAAASDALTLCRAIETSLEDGIPFLREERGARIEAIVEGLGETPEDRARALVELMGSLSEELRLAETIEERSEELDLPDGRRIHAYVVRLGLIQEAFVSEDGVDVGLSTPDGAWRTDLRDDERLAVITLIATARGRRAAGLVALPLSGARR